MSSYFADNLKMGARKAPTPPPKPSLRSVEVRIESPAKPEEAETAAEEAAEHAGEGGERGDGQDFDKIATGYHGESERCDTCEYGGGAECQLHGYSIEPGGHCMDYERKGEETHEPSPAQLTVETGQKAD